MELMKEFISLNRKFLFECNKIVFVLGNTGCDMDSTLSSILLSFSKNFQNDPNFLKIFPETIFLPLINTQKKLFPSKLDLSFLFKTVGIDYNDLLFFQEVFDSKSIKLTMKDIHFILVDHNILDPSQESLQDKVIGIYDHHEESNFKYTNLKEKVLVYPLGSCTTLILMNHYITNESLCKLFSKQRLEFLAAAIWLDSKGFDLKSENIRWIQLDLYVFNKLGSLGSIDKSFFVQLENNKYDIKANLELGLDFLLTKDLKTFDYLLNETFLSVNNLSDLTKYSSESKLKVKWASIQVDYFEITKFFSDQEVLKYFQIHSSPLFVTNSEYKKKFRLLTIYFKEGSEFYTQYFFDYFIKELESRLGQDIKEKISTNRQNYVIYFIKFEHSRKTLEPIFKNIFE